MTQTEFGSAVGVSMKTQLNYEMGTRSPDVNYLVACRKLGVDVHHVLFGEPDGTVRWVLSADEGLLLKLYRDASAPRRVATFAALGGAELAGMPVGGNNFYGDVGVSGVNNGDVNMARKPGGEGSR